MHGVAHARRSTHENLARLPARREARSRVEVPAMLAKQQAEKILRVLSTLPSEKVRQVEDFVCFLRDRYGVDDGGAWSDEDLSDLTAAVFNHADLSGL